MKKNCRNLKNGKAFFADKGAKNFYNKNSDENNSRG